ncbi:ALK tyrosine kinase receptor homolog scd-2-like [Anneissia japonica]|uniref:ALK tyrosine kinase receptor homolog scd-2-like n=1 Tax=Anneissia japonica TaxID=1529436 RepID=UPI0014256812|nr:ALK tyrosine kinase receptor homolog scd-2-like [Anneissia japonica]
MDVVIFPEDMVHLDDLLPNGVPLLSLDVLHPLMRDGTQVKLGKGAFGEVLLYHLGGPTGELAAVKTCRLADTGEKMERLTDKLQVSLEARAQMLLHAERNDVFPRVFGTCTFGSSDGIIMEFIGDPLSFQSVTLFDAITHNTVELSVTDGLHIALDLAKGTQTMQMFGLIHNDLASRNVLLYKHDSHWAAKITDFGCVCAASAPYDFFRLNNTPAAERKKLITKHREFAPELFYPESPPSFASDVYSIGVIIANIGRHVDSKLLVCIGQLCSSADPRERPNIDDIVDNLVSRIS